MTITMNDSAMKAIAALKKFLNGTQLIQFKGISRKEEYGWMHRTLKKFQYFKQRKKEKNVIKQYMMRMTGYSDAQMTRLMTRDRLDGRIAVRAGARCRFARTYQKQDSELLAETDNLHERLSGPATRKLLQRAYSIYQDLRFERLKDISVAHIYNLRATKQYNLHSVVLAKTRPVKNDIG